MVEYEQVRSFIHRLINLNVGLSLMKYVIEKPIFLIPPQVLSCTAGQATSTRYEHISSPTSFPGDHSPHALTCPEYNELSKMRFEII